MTNDDVLKIAGIEGDREIYAMGSINEALLTCVVFSKEEDIKSFH